MGYAMEKMGFDGISGRHEFLINATDAAELPSRIVLPSSRFVCLVVWDAVDVEDETITHLAQQLLLSGAVYVCAWGPDCMRVHDLVDAVAVDSSEAGDNEAVVMTTWHEDESISEAVWFSRRCALPDRTLFDDCGSTLVLVIGSAAWADEARSAFRDDAGNHN
jgi:hypothetical protein